MARYVSLGLKLAISFAFVVLFASHLDLRATMRAMADLSWAALIISVGWMLLQSMAIAARLSSVVAIYKIRLPFFDSYRLTLESMFFSQTFVSFIGGDALRIWRIRHNGLPLAEATSVIVLDRVIGIVVNHVCFVASLPWLLGLLPAGGVRGVLILLAVGGAVGLAVLVLLGFLRGRLGIFRRLPEGFRLAAPVTLLLESSTVGRHFLDRFQKLGMAFVLSVVVALCNVFVFASLLLGMGVSLYTAVGCALLVPAILEIAMLPLSVAGWGVREGAAVVAFGAIGVTADVSLAASVAFGLITLAVAMVGGLLWLIDRRDNVGSKGEQQGQADLALKSSRGAVGERVSSP